jgi:hypothetical protein
MAAFARNVVTFERRQATHKENQYRSEESTLSRLIKELERRDFPRVRRRLPCSLLIGGRCHSATVRDLSANGFFVETDAHLHLGSGVIVTVSGPDGARFLLETYVPRCPALLRERPYMAQSGVGLKVEDPPESYLRWIEKFAS